MTRIEAIGATAAGAALAGFVALLLVTSSHWFVLRGLTVADAKQGFPAKITYDREFYRDFDGAWRVLIWQIERGEWQSYCEASGAWGYRKARPDPNKDLAWLVDGEHRCSDIPAGTYAVELQVSANPGSLIERSQTITSNPFEVRP